MACMICSLSTLMECRQCQLLMTWPGLCSICSRPSECPTSSRLPAASHSRQETGELPLQTLTVHRQTGHTPQQTTASVPLQAGDRRTPAPNTDGTQTGTGHTPQQMTASVPLQAGDRRAHAPNTDGTQTDRSYPTADDCQRPTPGRRPENSRSKH